MAGARRIYMGGIGGLIAGDIEAFNRRNGATSQGDQAKQPKGAERKARGWEHVCPFIGKGVLPDGFILGRPCAGIP
jgi:hypothetical protein